MGSLMPPFDLKGHCAVIDKETLYTYSPDGLLSLPLKEGAEWSVLPMGVSVTGGACVRTIPNGDESQSALWVIGGTTNSSMQNYPGIQRYTFSSKKWDTITPVVPVTQNRQHHAAAYLNSSQMILVYAGSQDGEAGPSSQTFTISIWPPYAVQAHNTQVFPAVDPILLRWDNDRAAMVGGGESNKDVYLFSPSNGWKTLGVPLTDGIHDQNTHQCTIVSGDDGSKVLNTYDFGSSPNTVKGVALLGLNGILAVPGSVVGLAPPDRRRSTTELSLAGWPRYNKTLAPKETRSGYVIAQDDNGLAVISGGNPDNPVVIFDQRKNGWKSNQEIFGAPLSVSTSGASSTRLPSVVMSTATSSGTSSPSQTNPSNLTDPGQPKSRVLTVLGATLGAIFGLAAILIILLLLLRWRREKRKSAAPPTYVNEKEDRLSFADQGTEFMHTAGGSVGKNYASSINNNSTTSLAIISGAIGKARNSARMSSNHKRAMPSDSSQANLMPKSRSPLHMEETHELSPMEEKSNDGTPPERSGHQGYVGAAAGGAAVGATAAALARGPHDSKDNYGRSRSSGWSRYFNNDSNGYGAGRNTYGSEERTSSGSLYTDSRSGAMSGVSNQVKPLELNLGPRFDADPRQRFSRVNTGSPIMQHSDNLKGTGMAVSEGMSAELARANSGSSNGTYDYISHNNHKGPSNWTPMDNPNNNAWNKRPVSSLYTDSQRNSAYPPDNTSSFYQNDGTSSYYPPTNGVNSAMYPTNPNGPGLSDARDSTVTVFPRGVPDSRPTTAVAPGARKDLGHQDMSWLNLGAGTAT